MFALLKATFNWKYVYMSLIIGGQNTRPLKTQGGQNCVLGGLTLTLTDIPLK